MNTKSTSSKRKQCGKCQKRKPLDQFHRDKRKGDGRCVWCKDCACSSSRAWSQSNPERQKEGNRKRYQANAERVKERAKEWAKNNPEKRREIVKENGRKKRAALKLEVLNAYGGPVCACCGEDEFMFLTVDHMENDGHEHRKTVHALKFYGWLKANGFPAGFQVLCRNCNWGKHINGGVCPHQRKGKS